MAKNYKLGIAIKERNAEAMQAEKNDNPSKAIRLYEQNIKEDYADEFAFDRLMVIYRRQKEYADELRVINRGIEVFRNNLERHLEHSLHRRGNLEKVAQISRAIMRKSGVKKEDPSFPDPIDKWMKRKKIVTEKLRK
jgi:tetratricopeptide (TPR) repeat protein